MNSLKILFLLISLFNLIQTQTLSQQLVSAKQLIINLENLQDETVINFKTQNGQFFDQLYCLRSKCECIFTQSNISYEQIEILECNENKLTIQRENSELIASLNSLPRRIMAEVYTDSDMTDSKTIDSSLTIKWKFNSDDTIEFATIWNKKTWLGIGFGSSMSNVDMITLNVSGSTVELLDLFSTSQSTPPTDSQQDYELISYEVGSASVKARFKRKLSTGDSKDKTLTKGSTYNWCYAYSSALQMEKHTANLGFSITLSDSGTSSTDTGSTTSGSSSSASSGSSGSTSSGSSNSTSTGTSGSTSSSSSNSTSTGTSGSTSGTSNSTSDDSEDSESSITSTKTSFQIQLAVICLIQIIIY